VFLLRAWHTQMRRRARPVFGLLPGGPSSGQIAAGTLAGSNGEAVSTTRASPKRVITTSGVWVEVGSGNPGVDVHGLNAEPAATNNLLHCRDFTQSAWVKTNCTAAKLTTGIDGAEDSASTLTATAANATAIQSRTLTSAARVSSFFVRRRSGTGAIEITRNNGTNWTTLNTSNCIDPLTGAGTAPHAEGWVRVSLTSTLANPAVGLRLVTSGDAIDVDFAQDEVGAVATSPILTGGGTGTRAADVVTTSTSGWPAAAGEFRLTYTPASTPATNILLDTRTGSTTQGVLTWISGGALSVRICGTAATNITTTATAWTVGQAYAIRVAWGAGNVYIYRDGVLVGSDVTGTANMPGSLNADAFLGGSYGGADQARGSLHSVEVWPA
jgi:hypothetical protein